MTRYRHRSVFRMVFMGLILHLWLTAHSAAAEQTLRSLRQGMTVTLKNHIDTVTTPPGTSFEAVLPEPVRYRKYTLPADTRFRGQVQRVAPSKHFGRPGYLLLDVQEATLPNGTRVNLDQYPDRNRKFYPYGDRNLATLIANQVPYSAAGYGLSIPLRTSASVKLLPAAAAGLGIRSGVGALFWLVRPKMHGQPIMYRLAKGILEGSGATKPAEFIGKYPDPVFLPGDSIKLYFPPQALKDLMVAGGQSPTSALIKRP